MAAIFPADGRICDTSGAARSASKVDLMVTAAAAVAEVCHVPQVSQGAAQVLLDPENLKFRLAKFAGVIGQKRRALFIHFASRRHITRCPNGRSVLSARRGDALKLIGLLHLARPLSGVA